MEQQFKEFKVGDLFRIIPTKNYKRVKDGEIISKNGTIPFITTTVYNNGVKGYSNLEPNNKGNVITMSDTTTSESSFYQYEDFIGRSHVQKLEPLFDKFNKYIALYIITSYKKVSEGLYDYGNKMNRERIGNTVIKLPVTSEGELDFEYMENYIKEIEHKYIQNLRDRLDEKIVILLELTQKTEDDISDGNIEELKKKVRLEYNQKEFKEFKIEDIFEGVIVGKQPKASNRFRLYDKGMKPVITGVTVNNGIGFYSYPEGNKTYKNILTLSKDGEYAGKPFIQSNSVILGGHSLGLIPKYDSLYVLMYVSSIFNKLLDSGFWRHGGVMGSVTLAKLREISLNLPVTSEGEIDYEFMERYVKSLEAVHTHTIRVLEEERIELLEGLVMECQH